MRTLKTSANFSLTIHIIRIVAAWFVAIGHGFSFFRITPFQDQTYFPFFQNIGVVLLLFLSGMLMVMSLERKTHASYSFREYIVDKFCRIIIPLLPALLLVALVDGFSMSHYPQEYAFAHRYNIQTFLGSLMLVQGIPLFGNINMWFGSAEQLWTLCIEWWIYIPIGYLALVVIPNRRKLRLYHIIILGILSYSMIAYLQVGMKPCAPIIMFLGMIAYYGIVALAQCEKKRMLDAATIILFALMIVDGCIVRNAYDIGFIMLLCACAMCALARTQQMNAEEQKKKSMPLRKIITFLAGYTYSLYLIHYSIMDMFYRRWIANYSADPSRGTITMLVSLIISNAVAICFSMLFEKNSKTLANAIKKKLFPALHTKSIG